MHPILFDLEFLPKPIHTYGLMLALGFLIAIIWGRIEAKKAGMDPIHVSDLMVWAILGGIIGARLLYVFIHMEEFSGKPWKVFYIWEGGLVYYGGLLGGVAGGIFFSIKRKLYIPGFADIIMPALMLGQSIGRWGCFMSGCCYGKETTADFPFAVAFPETKDSMIPPQFQNPDLADPACYLHPTQIYMSINALLIWLVLWFLLRRRKFYGFVTGVFLVLYAISRSSVELVRGDMGERGYFGPLSTSQWVSVPILLFGIYLIYSRKKRPVKAQEK